MNNMLIVTLASVGIFLAVSGNLNVNGNLLPLIVVAGVSLWCVQNRKSNKKMGESCFLVSIYFLSVLLSKMLDINEKFNTPDTGATVVNDAYSGWGATSISSPTQAGYELYNIALNLAISQADNKLITAFVNNPNIFQTILENQNIQTLIGNASSTNPISSTDLKTTLENVVQSNEAIQNITVPDAPLLEYNRKILTHIQNNKNILLRLRDASDQQARIKILQEIMVPYEDLLLNAANQSGVSQEQVSNVQNRILESIEKNSQSINNLLSNLSNINSNLINQNNLPIPNMPNPGDILDCNNVSTARQIIQQNSPQNLASFDSYVNSACGNNNLNKPAIIGKLAENQAQLDELNTVSLGVGEIAGITGGAVGFVLLCIGVGVFLSNRNN